MIEKFSFLLPLDKFIELIYFQLISNAITISLCIHLYFNIEIEFHHYIAMKWQYNIMIQTYFLIRYIMIEA